MVRERSAPARFAHVMSSTSPALAINTSSGVRVSPTIESRRGFACKRNGPSSLGYSLERSFEMLVTSSFAFSIDTPGLRRATKPMLCDPRTVIGSRMSEGSDIARKTSTSPMGDTKLAGSTPATVRVMPFT